MATVSADLFVDNAGNTLLFNQFGGAPALPAMVPGDTLNLSVFFLDRGSGSSPYKGARYAGATVKVRMRAAGNNTVYAIGTASAEITPATGVTTTTPIAHGNTTAEKQRAVFASLPFTGVYKLNFPTLGNGGGTSLQNASTAAIPWNATAAAILDAVLDTRGYYDATAGKYTYPELAARYIANVGNDEGTRPIVTGDATDLSTGLNLQFGSLYGGANYWRNQPQLTVDDSDIQYKFGWSVSVPLTDPSFADLFTNGPSYIEVLLTPSGGSQAYAAQYELNASTSGGSSGDPPSSPPVGGGIPGTGDNGAGVTYVDGDFTIPKAVDIVVIDHPFPQTPSARIYRQPYWQLLSSFAELALDSACPYDPAAGLVEESAQRSVGGGGVVEWERKWATVPPTRIERELVNYAWQIMGTLGGANALATFNLTRLAKVTYSYHRTTNSDSISRSKLPRVTLFANVFYYTEGSYSNPTLGSEVIARDDTVERWMGNIWVKTHTTIVI